jgi:hypothetical protein
MQLISNFLYNKNMPPFMKNMFITWTWWKTKLYKISKYLKFEGEGCKEKELKKTIWKKICVQWVQNV